MRRQFGIVLISVHLSASCLSESDEIDNQVSGPQVLAIRASPPEAHPGDPVTFDALVADDSAQITVLSWSFCSAPRVTSQSISVNEVCLDDATALTSIGVGDSQSTSIPSSACITFGPDAPPGVMPTPPDDTGGYYQPVVVTGASATAVGFARVMCDLANATQRASITFSSQYNANNNPQIAGVSSQVQTNGDVQLWAWWDASSAESYVSFEPSTQSILPRRESMEVTWWATSGTLTTPRTFISEQDAGMITQATTMLVNASNTGTVWVVLRDARGGVDWAMLSLNESARTMRLFCRSPWDAK
jgi:hypothetical protein